MNGVLKLSSGNKANLEARLCSLFIGVELEGHFVVFGHQLEILGDTGATEPGLGVFFNTSNKEIVLGFAAAGPFHIELVKEELYASRFCREYPGAVLVMGIFARISWRFKCVNS